MTGNGRSRSRLSRVLLLALALLFALFFTSLAAAAFTQGQLFLAVMSAIGGLMTVWVGGLSARRGGYGER